MMSMDHLESTLPWAGVMTTEKAQEPVLQTIQLPIIIHGRPLKAPVAEFDFDLWKEYGWLLADHDRQVAKEEDQRKQRFERVDGDIRWAIGDWLIKGEAGLKQ